jgi:ABC-type multidrug transport system permease subunit
VSKTGDLVFAFVHLAALFAVLGYALYSLVIGNVPRFGLIIVLLVIYYWGVLHPAVKKEIARRRSLKR